MGYEGTFLAQGRNAVSDSRWIKDFIPHSQNIHKPDLAFCFSQCFGAGYTRILLSSFQRGGLYLIIPQSSCV